MTALISRNSCQSLIGIIFLILSAASCATGGKPCHEGGQPARDPDNTKKGEIGSRQCDQVKAANGRYLNEGVYREWYSNGKLALEGEYKQGLKSGKWREWDQSGKFVSEHWFDGGVETAPARPIGPGKRDIEIPGAK